MCILTGDKVIFGVLCISSDPVPNLRQLRPCVQPTVLNTSGYFFFLSKALHFDWRSGLPSGWGLGVGGSCLQSLGFMSEKGLRSGNLARHPDPDLFRLCRLSNSLAGCSSNSPSGMTHSLNHGCKLHVGQPPGWLCDSAAQDQLLLVPTVRYHLGAHYSHSYQESLEDSVFWLENIITGP